jgi:hypothetical protein
MRATGHLLCAIALGAALFGIDSMHEGERALRSDAASDEALLAAAARDAGLGRGDAFLAETLVRRVAFLAPADASLDERRVAALDLGIEERDPGVRARLASLFAARIREAAALAPLDEAALATWFEAERARWRRPATVDLVHVYFAGHAALERAKAVRADLAHDGGASASVAEAGDPSIYGALLVAADEATLAARFGPAFAARVFATPLGVWSEPLASSQGLHLVLVRRSAPARDPALDEVRAEVEATFRTARADAALDAALAALRARAGAPPG